MTEGVLYTDGASFGNPGPSGIGVVLETSDDVVERSEDVGWGTNNQAEYRALIHGLRVALEYRVDVLHVRSDSQLLMRQVVGEYKVKQPKLKPLLEEVLALVPRFERVSFEHVRRGLNERADELAKQGAEKARARGASEGQPGLFA